MIFLSENSLILIPRYISRKSHKTIRYPIEASHTAFLMFAAHHGPAVVDWNIKEEIVLITVGDLEHSGKYREEPGSPLYFI